MIKVDHLRRNYDDFTAVNDVSFEIGQSEIVGLLGHNGAGKTTIMKMLTGYIEPSAGQILINSMNIQHQPGDIQKRLGYLPENLPVYPEMTVIEYLHFAARLRQIPEKECEHAVNRAIVQTNLQTKALQPIQTLSRGYKQRVGVAQAIIHQPEILILDEPTNGLDPSQTLQMRELILQLSRHATIILSTHIMQEVEAICSRVLILNQGKLALDSRLDALKQNRSLLLSTNAELTALTEILQGLGECRAECISDNNYRIHYDGKQTREQQVNHLARELFKQNYDIYKIMPEQRDLESVFREVSEIKKELNHAA